MKIIAAVNGRGPFRDRVGMGLHMLGLPIAGTMRGAYFMISQGRADIALLVDIPKGRRVEVMIAKPHTPTGTLPVDLSSESWALLAHQSFEFDGNDWDHFAGAKEVALAATKFLQEYKEPQEVEA